MCFACDWSKYLTVPRRPAASSGTGSPHPRGTDQTGLEAAVGAARPFEAVAIDDPGVSPQPFPYEQEGADVVFRRGGVYTVDADHPWAEAVAVRDGTIVYVGDDDGVAAFIGPATRVVELSGRMLLPGFVEGHIHPIIGATATRGVDLQYDTPAEMVEVLRAHARQIGTIDVVRGFGWRYGAFPPSGPHRDLLDAIWPDTSVVLLAIDGHSAWVNTRALEIAGITRDTPDPVPGFSTFKRDAAGEATGYLIEVPALLAVLTAAAPFTVAAIAEALVDWLPKASAAGITSVFDAGLQILSNEDGFALYEDLAQRGALPFRVVGSYYHNDAAIDPLPLVRALRQRFDSALVRASVLKLNMDGVDAGYTAAMLAPYSDDPGTSGQTLLSADLARDIVRRADAENIDVHVHAIGDRATRLTLDAIEAAIAENPPRDRRHAIAHLQGVDETDLARFAPLGVIAQFSAQWAVPDHYWATVTTARWGTERAGRTYRFGTLLRAGTRLSLGTDWPAAAHFSTFRPLDAIEIATTRQELGGDPAQTPLPPADECIPLADAIHANTLGAAYQIRLDGICGSIEVGKRADLIVLDRDLFAIDANTIHEAEVLLTLTDGIVRHDRGI
jgi:predicted amidohydrolase YtcJ